MTHKATTKLCMFLEKKYQIATKDSKQFLCLIYADPKLPGLLQIAINLIEILPILIEIAPADWSKKNIDSHISVCKNIISSSVELSLVIDGFDKPKKFGTGSLTRFPLYSALWFQSPDIKMNTHFNHLQAHFINACNLYDGYLNTNPPSDIKNASLSIRKIKINTLKKMPQAPLSIEGFSTYLNKKREYTNDQTKLQIDRIKLVLDHATGDKETWTRSINKKTNRKLTANITEPIIDPEATIQLSPSILVKHTSTKEKDANESFKQGNAIEDSFTGPTYFSDSEKPSPDSNDSKKIQAIKTRNKSRYIATNNQNNPFKWERLNFHDVLRLFDTMDDIKNGLYNEMKLSEVDKYELTSLINIMYWTSSSAEKALNIKVSKTTSRATKVVDKNDIYFCKDDNTWVLSLPTLEKRRQLSSIWEDHVESTKDYICLDAPLLAVNSLQKILRNNTKSLNKKSRLLFKNTNKKKLIDYLNKFLSIINKKFRTRLTAIRISTHLFQTLTNQLGDIADSSFITGNTPSLGQKAALYYYAPHQSFLQKSYTDTCNSISRAISTGLNWNKIKNIEKNYSNVERIGSRLCPLESTVKNLVTDLKANIKRCRKNKKNVSYIINFHNAYTSYCVILLGYFTGYRAVFDPFYSQTEIDLDSGFLVISDKDGNDYYNSRTVWLPEICIKQLEKYNSHRIAIMEKLTLLNPILSEQIKNKEQLNWTGKRTKNHIPFLFFLNESCNYLAVCSKSLHKFVSWSYELPLNTNRHFLRTKFREKNIPGEICDGLLGHWECGQEPYGRFSTLSPSDFKNKIRKPLEELSEESNWTVVQGLQSQYSEFDPFEFPPKKNKDQNEQGKKGGHSLREEKRKCRQAKEREKQHKLVLAILRVEEPKLLEDIYSLKIKDERVNELFKKVYQDCHGHTIKIRHNYLIAILEKGVKEKEWELLIPNLLLNQFRDQTPHTPKNFIPLKALSLLRYKFIKSIEDPQFYSLGEKYCSKLRVKPSKSRKIDIFQLQAAQIIFSAIVNGALLNKTWISCLGRAIEETMIFDDNVMWLEMELNVGAGDSAHTIYHRWYPDPLTTLLILRWRKNKLEWPKETEKNLLSRYYSCLGVKPNEEPTLSQLITAATTRIGLKIPQYLVHYAKSNKLGQSLSPITWNRLIKDHVIKPNKIKPSKEKIEDKNRSLSLKNNQFKKTSQYTDQHSKYKEFRNILSKYHYKKAPDLSVINKQINLFLTKKNKLSSILRVIVMWTLKMMTSNSITGYKKKPSSMLTYLSSIAPRLIIYASDFDIFRLTQDEWVDIYDFVIKSAPVPKLNQQAYKAGRLKEFQRFLELEFGVAKVEIEDIAGVATKVDTNILTPKEFSRICNYFDKGIAKGNRLCEIQKLLLILGFRCGLRRFESAKLTLTDLQDEQEILVGKTLQSPRQELLIRYNIYGKVKSFSSIRRIPLYSLLTSKELDQLIQWKRKRLAEISKHKITNQLLFCLSGQDSKILKDKDSFYPIQKAMRNVSGDENLRFHHLRHSFANFTLLRLIDDASHELLPKKWITDKTNNELLPLIEKSTRAHLLLIKDSAPTRKMLYAVSQLCGHLDPQETMSTYLHTLDWILGKELRKQSEKLTLPMQANLLSIKTSSLSVYRRRKKLKGNNGLSTALELLETIKIGNKYPNKTLLGMKPAKPIQGSPSLANESKEPTIFTLYSIFHRQYQKEKLFETAYRYGFSNHKLKSWVECAKRLANIMTSQNNPLLVRNKKIILNKDQLLKNPNLPGYSPAPPYIVKDMKDATNVYNNLLILHKTKPKAIRENLRLYIKRTTSHEAIFIPKNDAELASFVQFLREIGIAERRIRIKLRPNSNKKEKDQKVHWSVLLAPKLKNNRRKTKIFPKQNIQIDKKNTYKSSKNKNGHTSLWIAKSGSTTKPFDSKDLDTWPMYSIRVALYMGMVILGVCDS